MPDFCSQWLKTVIFGGQLYEKLSFKADRISISKRNNASKSQYFTLIDVMKPPS